jgi:L-2-hydroxycarboxylate dehydrogenase (NAD+)
MSGNRWSYAQLEMFSKNVFMVLGVSEHDADLVARSLVDADLIGVSTHGVARLPSYVQRLKRGLVNPVPKILVESALPWSSNIFADNAMGAVVGTRAVQEVRDKIEKIGIGVAVVRGSNHFGTAGYYARALAGDDCISICLSPASKSLAPYGSQEPLFGTNPWSVSVPAGRYPNWTMDMATSVAARGHIRLAARAHQAIPEGWALDEEGKPTTDPVAALRGVMLPFAGPKGSALAMMVDILGGVLSGSAFGGEIRDMNVDFDAPQDVGHFFMAFKVAGFMPLSQFTSRMEDLISRLKLLKPAAGISEVMYPGEIEFWKGQDNRATGVLLPDEISASLKQVAEEFGLAFPSKILVPG